MTVPKNYDVRPTGDRVKESVFNIIGSRIIGADVIDLFAGTGNLGLESWSRGAASATFVDIEQESLRLVRSNITKCRAGESCIVYKGGAEVLLPRLYAEGKRYDFAFCDPPYNKGWTEKIAAALAQYPVLKEGGYLIIERSREEQLPDFAEGYETVRSSRYGDTVVDFVKYISAREK